MRLFRVRCTAVAEVSLTCCPSSQAEMPPPQAWVLPVSCLGFPSFPQGALAVSTLFAQLLYAQLCTSRTTSFSQIVYVEFAVSCSVHGDLPSACFEIKLIKLERN